jgi:hypothetical protein
MIAQNCFTNQTLTFFLKKNCSKEKNDFFIELFSKVYTYIIKNIQSSKPFKGKCI